ncbi:MAG TPA: YoaK family protein [Polyangiaceae bacterium]|nr:YoaK family protein [Polyangiaceae bacterium]
MPSASTLPKLSPSALPSARLNAHAVLLSAVAGYVDAVGFASLIGLFPAHLTGELVGDAIAFTSGQARGGVTRLWMLPVFVGAVVTATLVARLLRFRGQRPLGGLLALVTVALALFSVSDAFVLTLIAPGHLSMLLSGGFAVAAMGFQNALMRESLVGSCPTTVMTGNLTQVVMELVDQVVNRVAPARLLRSLGPRPASRLKPVAAALFAFVACAMLGGWMSRVCGSLSVALPTAVTLALTLRACFEDRRMAARTSHPAAIAASAELGPVLPEFAALEAQSEQILLPPPPEGPRPPMRRTVSGTQRVQRPRDDT